jgi:hypothetical protein
LGGLIFSSEWLDLPYIERVMNGQEKARHIVVVMAKTATQVWTRDERKPKAGCGFKSEERFYR